MTVHDRDPALHETSGGARVGASLPPPELCLASQARRSLSAYARLEQSERGRAFLPALPSRVEGGRGGELRRSTVKPSEPSVIPHLAWPGDPAQGTMAALAAETYLAPVSGWPLRPFERPATSSQRLHREEAVVQGLFASPNSGACGGWSVSPSRVS